MELQILGLAWRLCWAVLRCASSRRIHELGSFNGNLDVLLVCRHFMSCLLHKSKIRSCRFIGLMYGHSLFARFDIGWESGARLVIGLQTTTYGSWKRVNRSS